ncbi:Oidioi.mRNA.OKI2018_I69.XSR.g13367.t1.cds [Oikopleura dioica]|uniref:Oidioi.mRNA.OKI2018_I69.XSR.g13367.t1.cds n=1 Tax=Oikopleura dioica TaxID=34765 RepID=A0ABN7SBV0_OIKDI|nr:Oidioi.mRNA.OKI2018_I69.XSR.g13367.t1.cds [Oikopleura dioica]
MLKGPQYKKIVLAHWMRIVGLFWLLVSNLATVCYIGPRVAFCVFEMLLLYWDILLYANISEIVSSSHSWIIFTFYFAAVVKVFVTSIYFLNPSKETLIRSKFHHSVALLFFHQLFLMFTQFKYAQEMHFISAETSEDLAILLQKKAQFLIFFRSLSAVLHGDRDPPSISKDSKETIAKADAVIWNFFSLSSVVYNVLILLCLKPALQLLPKKCVKVEPAQLSFIPSLDCFGHFELILSGCGSIQILLYLWIAFKSFAKN